jgi:hypothetical protein
VGFDAPEAANMVQSKLENFTHLKMSQVLTVSCKLKITPRQLEKLDALLAGLQNAVSS